VKTENEDRKQKLVSTEEEVKEINLSDRALNKSANSGGGLYSSNPNQIRDAQKNT